ncbi:hypothetical protein [Cellulomonas sp.]|uniref:COG1470 family protein n=1 Tax=Cellulomonas sp. TaxID=40001 RepID=UPI001B24E90D|nr:hypothetical protein [Cellulomonas sp.]MBO9556485.1 hypothetical protein [Cellulomonas sp.]
MRIAVLPAALLALLTLLTGGPASAAPTDPGGTVTWTVQPATADGPDGRISLRHTLDPGATVTDHVTVTNFSDHDATFVVYAGDGTVSPAGDFDVRPEDDGRSDGGAWVLLTAPSGVESLDDGRLRVTLAATAAVTIPLTIAVPAGATPGDHPVGVVAELIDDPGAVQLAARVGVRLHLRVTGTISAGMVADDVHAWWSPSWNPFSPGVVHVTYVLRNTGDVRLGARSAVTLAGPGGAAAVSSTSSVREVLPQRSAPVDVTLRAWPLVRAGGHVDVTPLVVGEDVVDAPLRPTSTAVIVWTPPWSWLLLVLLVSGGVLVVRWQRRRTARQVQARVDAALAAAGVAPQASVSETEETARAR